MPGIVDRLIRLLALLLLAWLPQAGLAVSIDAARIWPSTDYTRLTLESSQPISYNMFTLANPNRVVIDLMNVDMHGALAGLATKLSGDDPYVKSLRIAQNSPTVVRLVLDLKVAAKPQLFSLNPVAQYGHRLVLDVYPAVPLADPLLALADKGDKKAAAPAASAVAASAPAASAPAATDPLMTLAINAEKNLATARTPDTASKDTASKVAAADARGGTTVKTATPPAKGRTEMSTRMLIVVIDAGHGGEDPGAHGRQGTLEKDVTLQIARRLRDLINETGSMRAVLTRDGDYFIELGQRVVKARNARADLFISIHADSFIRSKASGSSVFALSEHGATSAAARWLAKHENEADLIGGVNVDTKDPYLKKTLIDLSQTATISDSLKLGKHVLHELGDINNLHHSHVEQAGFAVLKAVDVPSILVETAFISNPAEERKLKDEQYQSKLARAILGGVKRYLAQNPALARQRVAQND